MQNSKLDNTINKRANILIVEDQRIVRQVLENAISDDGRYNVFASIENASLAEMYCANGKIDLVIMDVYTAQRENGLEAARKIKKYYPKIKIIIVTSMPEHSFIKKAISYGCESFWYKDSSIEEFLDVITLTLEGKNIYPKETPVLQIGLAKSTEFTERELEVLRELVNGYSHQEICEHLDIAKTTLQYHINNVLTKSGYDSKIKLIIDITDKKFIIPGF